MSAYVEIVFDNSDGRFPVAPTEYDTNDRPARMKSSSAEQSDSKKTNTH